VVADRVRGSILHLTVRFGSHANRSRQRLDDFLDFADAFAGFLRLEIQRRQQTHDLRARRNREHADFMQAIHKLQRRRFIAFGKRRDFLFFNQFQAQDETQAASAFDDLRILCCEPFQFVFEPFAEFAGLFVQPFAFDDLEHLERNRTGQRRAAKCRGVRARPSKSAYGARTQNAPMGNPPPSDLAIETPSGRNFSPPGTFSKIR